MVRQWMSALLLLGACTVFTAPARAQAPANEPRHALVVGNANYREAPLRNPVNDATDMAATLRTLGFTVTLLTDADNRRLRAAIREFAEIGRAHV